MTLTRRKTLSVLGGGSILAATGFGYAVTRRPSNALEPWRQAGSFQDPRAWALSYAILAPNPHNRQPWLVEFTGDEIVTLWVDTERLLPHTDPFSRQIVVGLGCFLELMTLAANEIGYAVTLELFPDGEDSQRLDQRPVAVARFEKAPKLAKDALFQFVLARRSLKEPYATDRPVTQGVLDRLVSAAQRGSLTQATNATEDVTTLREVTADALRIEFLTPRTLKESVNLFRIGHREVNANPDGLDFSGPLFETLRLTGLFSREQALDPESISFNSALDMVQEVARSGMAYVWQTTPGNTRAEQIQAGRDWVRINLAATELGLGVQPMSQALQEFPEMEGLYSQVHEMLAPDGGIVQMLGRLGYGPDVAQSPRWPLQAKMRTA